MEIFLLFIRLALFGIFSLAGIGKLYDPKGSRKALQNFGVPISVSNWLGFLLPVAEILIAVCFLPVQTSWYAAIAGAMLMSIFVGGMLWQMHKGNAPDCHCFGQIHSEPVSNRSLLRNALFLLLLFVLVGSGKEYQGINIFYSFGEGSGMNGLQLIIGLIVIGFLAAIVYFLKQISGQQNQIMRRIEILELVSSDGGKEVERTDFEAPSTGLPIGMPLPEFEVSNLAGKKFSEKDILPNNKASLIFFVSPSCSPCKTLIPEIQVWEKKLAEKINFVFISNGKAKENEQKFAGSGFENFYLQSEAEVAEILGSKWTPTVLLVNPDRKLASKPKAGDTAIKEMFASIEKADSTDGFFYLSDEGSGKFGELVPEFEIEDLDGNKISNSAFEGIDTLVAYWNNSCPHCKNMLEDLREWDQNRSAEEPKLLVISSGEKEQNREMALESPVVLDDEHKLAQQFGMQGTPSAVLIGKNGKFVSETAVGAQNIWAMIGKNQNGSN